EAVALSDRIYVLSRRPARVISEVVVRAPRPRLGAPLPDEARALEEDLLNTLLSQTGERP
ncbi:ABC transporter ATP-binding protein, partial [Nitratireductor aquimarinus]|nr:ABC transporter ATP-binding protein [Nitratireductor aquimarinus]